MEQATKPPRVVGKIGATLMSVNGMIGAGIFALPALLYAEVGNFAPWMFLIFGILFSANTLVSAKLSNMFRSSGGPQLWVQAAFGPFLGFQIGWIFVLAMAAGRAATLYVLVAYLAVIVPVFADPIPKALMLGALLVALVWINITGMKNSIGGLSVGTVLKLAPILLLCAVGIGKGGIATEFVLPSFGAIESVALLVFFAFSGANSASFSAGELRNPRRDLPITMLVSLGLIIVFYMLVQWAYIASGAPQSADDATPLAAAAGAVMGDTGVLLLSLAAIFSIGTNALAYTIAGGRVTYGMADRGLLPAWLAVVSKTHRTPANAILLFGGLIAIMLSSGAFTFLATTTALGSQIIVLSFCVAFLALLRRKHGGHSGNLVFWIPVTIVAMAFSLFAAVQAPFEAYALFGVLLAAGTLLYFVARRGEVSAPEPIFE